MAKRKSKWQQAYNKSRKNYLSRIRNAEKKGYILPDSFYVPLKKASKRAIEQLNRIKIRGNQKKLGKVDIETGEIIKLLPKRRRKKPIEEYTINIAPLQVVENAQPLQEDLTEWSNIIISNFKDYLTHNFSGSPFITYALEWLNQMLAEFDDDVVAEKLEEAKYLGMFPQTWHMYKAEYFMECIADLTSLFNFTKEQRSEVMDWFNEKLSDEGLI